MPGTASNLTTPIDSPTSPDVEDAILGPASDSFGMPGGVPCLCPKSCGPVGLAIPLAGRPPDGPALLAGPAATRAPGLPVNPMPDPGIPRAWTSGGVPCLELPPIVGLPIMGPPIMGLPITELPIMGLPEERMPKPAILAVPCLLKLCVIDRWGDASPEKVIEPWDVRSRGPPGQIGRAHV